MPRVKSSSLSMPPTKPSNVLYLPLSSTVK
jgi:hypothetical protein